MPKNNHRNDEIVFLSEEQNKYMPKSREYWKILVVDDEESVHAVTKMVLNDFEFMGKAIQIYSAYTVKTAQKIIAKETDLAIVLLDVILETTHAGLDFVKYVRDVLKNNRVRIILRTGQPGEAPEKEIILKYDINDYKYKTELTEPRLIAVIAASLRSYYAFCLLEQNKLELEKQVKERTHQLEKAKNEALKANLAKSNFLAVMSHEIRTPMNSILGLLELLSETKLQPEQKKTLNTIVDTSKSFLNLINDLLDFSKIEVGHLHIEEQELVLSELIENIGTVIYPQTTSKAIRLSGYIAPDLPEVVWGDAFRIRQIMNNLLNNAVKFTNVGEVDFRVDCIKNFKDKALIRFQVSDTGVGIVEEDKTKLFCPFYQGENNTARIYGGSGLGLSICHNLTQMMNGSIHVESFKNKGSTFVVEIPFKKIKTNKKTDFLIKTKILAVLLGSQTAKNICEYLTVWRAKLEYIDSQVLETKLEEGYDDFDILFIELPALSAEKILTIKDKLSLKNKKIIILPFTNYSFPEIIDIYVLPFGFIKRDDLWSAFTQTYDPKFDNSRKNSSKTMVNTPLKVLIIDDNAVNRLVIKRQMERLGFIVDEASSGQEALVMLSEQYVLIFSDYYMPKMDGLELTKEIRRSADHRIVKIPIIIVTANAAKDCPSKCLAAGANDCLFKPFSLNDLKLIIQKWFPAFEEKKELLPDNQDLLLQKISQDERTFFFFNNAPFDMFRMFNVAHNDFSALPEILLLFLTSCSNAFDQVINAIQTKNFQEISFFAHKMKSLALIVGAKKIADAAYEIEKTAATKDYEKINFDRQFLYYAFLEVSYFIKEYLKK